MKRKERGFAVVEAILLSLVLIVPLVWLLGMLNQVHRAALGASAAAREAGFALARGTDPGEDGDRVDVTVAVALKDHQLDVGRARVDLSLSDGTSRGGLLRIEVRYPVPMLDLPVLKQLPSIWVTARHDAIVDRYRSR